MTKKRHIFFHAPGLMFELGGPTCFLPCFSSENFTKRLSEQHSSFLPCDLQVQPPLWQQKQKVDLPWPDISCGTRQNRRSGAHMGVFYVFLRGPTRRLHPTPSLAWLFEVPRCFRSWGELCEMVQHLAIEGRPV